MTGSTISHYKILDKLGEGGMGVVYKAEDTKLERTVALKFLAAHLLDDDEGKQRFLREAKAAAALHHPNICPVYEIDDANGRTFISMAFVDGETLEGRIAKGPLAIKDALDIGQQIAKGLHAAHEKGIVHRDIKPANILVAQDGQVTIMDFGLARLTEASRLTKPETTMGTVAYMSPEQAQGGEVDHRTDLWALGCVVYEMVAGARPFRGAYDQALLYEIVQQHPEPLTGVRAGVPMELEFIVGKSLAKDAADRYQRAEELSVDLRSLLDKLRSGKSAVLSGGIASAQVSERVGAAPSPSDHPLTKYRVIESSDQGHGSVLYQATDTELNRSVTINILPERATQQLDLRRRTVRLAWAGSVIVLSAIAALLWLRQSGEATHSPVRKFTFSPDVAVSAALISPNGRHIAYSTGVLDDRVIWVQDLDQETPRQIASLTVPVAGLSWSPDSRFLTYRADREVRKAAVEGGPGLTVCRNPGGAVRGVTWSADGTRIVFSSSAYPERRLYEVPAGGGSPRLLFDVDENSPLRPYEPHFLPEPAGQAILYSNRSPEGREEIIVRDLRTGQVEHVASGRRPRYSPTGHILYETQEPQTVWAIPFSLDSLRTTGEPFAMRQSASHASVSGDGSLVYVDSGQRPSMQLAWFGVDGQRLDPIGQPQELIQYPALSPDGARVAVTAQEGSEDDIWVHEVERLVKTRVTSRSGWDRKPIWLGAGEQLLFNALNEGHFDIYRKAADGSGEAELVYSTEANDYASDASSDGRYILYDSHERGAGDTDIGYLERQSDGSFAPRTFLKTPFTEKAATFSPDGRWVAYVGDESGAYQVYVQRFPSGGGKRQVSLEGGSQPVWDASGRKIYFVQGSTLHSAAITLGEDISIGAVEPLIESIGLEAFGNSTHPHYDVSADGTRFVVRQTIGEARASIRFVENWYEEFRNRGE